MVDDKYSRTHEHGCDGKFELVDVMDWDGKTDYMYSCPKCHCWYVNSR